MSNWKTEFQTAFKTLPPLYEFLNWPVPQELSEVVSTYSLFIPRPLAQKIKQAGPHSSLAKQFLPDVNELKEQGFKDPIGDKVHNKAPQLIHRYRSRALFTPTTICPVHCRYCFRKNELNEVEDFFSPDFNETLDYLKNHPEISEIIFTGGDPLTLSDEKIAFYLESFSQIQSIKDIRFHTRYPVILPSRITDELVSVLQKFKNKFRTISLAIHSNHIDEIDLDAQVAILKLKDFQLLSQTVLLKNVNDNIDDLVKIFNLFIKLSVRPYYLHHPDQVKGGLHFYLPLTQGRELYHQLRDLLPGWAIPHYVIDVPQGYGKITALNPETHHYSGNLLTLDGDIISAPEPS